MKQWLMRVVISTLILTTLTYVAIAIIAAFGVFINWDFGVFVDFYSGLTWRGFRFVLCGSFVLALIWSSIDD